MNLLAVDELLALGHGKIRSLDCVIAVKPGTFPSLSELRARILLAQKIFPKTGAHEVRLTSEVSLEEFKDARLATPFHLELGIVTHEGQRLLALKMSHLLGDAVSMLLWLKVILGRPVEEGDLVLKKFPGKKDSPYRKLRTSSAWPRPSAAISDHRGVVVSTIDHGTVDLTLLNDLFLLCLLDVQKAERKSVWVPVNVRKDFWTGFGNGLSRMRIYDPPAGTVPERLAHIRRQKTEAMKSGEVTLPAADLEIKNFLQRLLIKTWIRRPWADWASISLSHLVDRDHSLEGMEQIFGISNLMPKQHAALFVVSKARASTLTMTYDAKVVSREEAESLVAAVVRTFRAQQGR